MSFLKLTVHVECGMMMYLYVTYVRGFVKVDQIHVEGLQPQKQRSTSFPQRPAEGEMKAYNINNKKLLGWGKKKRSGDYPAKISK
jgi:hypothetical protein